MVIEFLITDRCNLKCSHCIRGDSYNNDMTFENFLIGIKKIQNYYDNPIIILSGGEPTIHSDFNKMLKYLLLETNLSVGICSNGVTSYFDTDLTWLQEYKNWIIFQISIDGDEQCNDFIRGNGTFKKAIFTTQTLVNYGFTVNISTTVTKSNIDSIDNLRISLEEIKSVKLKLHQVIPFGRAKDIKEYVQPAEWNKFARKILERTNIRLQHLNNLDELNLKKIEEVVAEKKTYNCGSGQNRIYACCCIKSHTFGNLKEQSLNEIFSSENAKAICNYKLREDSPCLACKYVKICNGGCKGMSMNNFGLFGVGEPRCSKFKQFASGTVYETNKLGI